MNSQCFGFSFFSYFLALHHSSPCSSSSSLSLSLSLADVNRLFVFSLPLACFPYIFLPWSIFSNSFKSTSSSPASLSTFSSSPSVARALSFPCTLSLSHSSSPSLQFLPLKQKAIQPTVLVELQKDGYPDSTSHEPTLIYSLCDVDCTVSNHVVFKPLKNLRHLRQRQAWMIPADEDSCRYKSGRSPSISHVSSVQITHKTTFKDIRRLSTVWPHSWACMNSACLL